jgi:hypothetical protein
MQQGLMSLGWWHIVTDNIQHSTRFVGDNSNKGGKYSSAKFYATGIDEFGLVAHCNG